MATGDDRGACPQEREIRLFPDSFDVAGSKISLFL